MPGTGELGPLPEHSPCSPGERKEGMLRQGENRAQDLGAVQGEVQTRSEGHRRISQVGFREGGRRGGREKRTKHSKLLREEQVQRPSGQEGLIPGSEGSQSPKQDKWRWGSEWPQLGEGFFHFYFIPSELRKYFMEACVILIIF